jgi:hypothetical protein
VLILVVEFIGLTSVLPYGLMLPFYTSSSGSKGLPIDDGHVVLPADKRFRVHILVPCYKVCFLHHLHACMPSDLSVLTCRFRHVCVCVCVSVGTSLTCLQGVICIQGALGYLQP